MSSFDDELLIITDRSNRKGDLNNKLQIHQTQQKKILKSSAADSVKIPIKNEHRNRIKKVPETIQISKYRFSTGSANEILSPSEYHSRTSLKESIQNIPMSVNKKNIGPRSNLNGKSGLNSQIQESLGNSPTLNRFVP